MDGTLEMIRDFQARHDREGKVVFITAEDLGNPDGFWPEKDDMCRAFAERTTGEWLWEVDYDEFYLEADMKSVFELLGADPSISAVSFPFRQFWGGFNYVETGLWFLHEFRGCDRVFRWRPGYTYSSHRPPTVLDAEGRDLRSLNWLSERDMRRRGIFMRHYSYVLPKQALQKVGYYTHATWTDEFQNNEHWLRDSYFGLKSPYFIGESGRSKPQWLERYRGPHPTQIVKMRSDLQNGRLNEPLRPTDDIERLLSSRKYLIGRRLMRVYCFFLFFTLRSYRCVRWRGARTYHTLRHGLRRLIGRRS